MSPFSSVLLMGLGGEDLLVWPDQVCYHLQQLVES